MQSCQHIHCPIAAFQTRVQGADTSFWHFCDGAANWSQTGCLLVRGQLQLPAAWLWVVLKMHAIVSAHPLSDCSFPNPCSGCRHVILALLRRSGKLVANWVSSGPWAAPTSRSMVVGCLEDACNRVSTSTVRLQLSKPVFRVPTRHFGTSATERQIGRKLGVFWSVGSSNFPQHGCGLS